MAYILRNVGCDGKSGKFSSFEELNWGICNLSADYAYDDDPWGQSLYSLVCTFRLDVKSYPLVLLTNYEYCQHETYPMCLYIYIYTYTPTPPPLSRKEWKLPGHNAPTKKHKMFWKQLFLFCFQCVWIFKVHLNFFLSVILSLLFCCHDDYNYCYYDSYSDHSKSYHHDHYCHHYCILLECATFWVGVGSLMTPISDAMSKWCAVCFLFVHRWCALWVYLSTDEKSVIPWQFHSFNRLEMDTTLHFFSCSYSCFVLNWVLIVYNVCHSKSDEWIARIEISHCSSIITIDDYEKKINFVFHWKSCPSITSVLFLSCTYQKWFARMKNIGEKNRGIHFPSNECGHVIQKTVFFFFFFFTSMCLFRNTTA